MESLLVGQYSLGPLPWSDETLVTAAWQNFRLAQRFVDEHPGRDLEERAKSLCSVLQIFNGAAQCFSERLARFHNEASGGHLFRRNRQTDLQAFEAGFQKTLYVFASSAMTLVDQSRNLNKKIELSAYAERVNVAFAENARHRFIQELRNDLIHVTLHKPGWEITTDRERQATSHFKLWPNQLIRSEKYHALARSYVAEHPNGIDLGELIALYKQDVNDFQGWLHTEL